MPRPYETMLIVRPDVVEDALEQLLTAQRTVLTDNGATEISSQVRGKRRFAYEMKGCKEGIYVQVNYESEPAAVTAWEKGMRLQESILRFMTVRPADAK